MSPHPGHVYACHEVPIGLITLDKCPHPGQALLAEPLLSAGALFGFLDIRATLRAKTLRTFVINHI